MFDVLIIGSGIAGLTAAIHAQMHGSRVAVISKTLPTKSQSCMAQGGINAALENSKDSVQQHIADTLKGAYGHADEEAVKQMCEEAPKIISWLDSIGVPFSRTAEGAIAQRTLGGSSHPRSCYSQDYTGLKVLHTLFDTCLKRGVTFFHERFLLEILTHENQAVGVEVLDIETSQTERYGAKSIILATGGYSKIYGRYSSNAHGASGDGIAIAKEAGCEITDMEFVQFHPTALKGSAILISESARGAGGHLVNDKNERFVDELLPRDVVSRAIHDQLERGHEVFLDIRHLGEAFLDENLPQERKLAILYEGIDPLSSPIPIKPAAHYTIGGIKTDLSTQSTLKALFACGECANAKVHGANRLGGNSLMEACVFGKQAGIQAAEFAKNALENSLNQASGETISALLERPIQQNFYTAWEKLSEMMMTHAGLIRSQTTLERLKTFIDETSAKMDSYGIADKNLTYNTNLIDYFEFSHALRVAQMVVDSALIRRQSLGAHFRSDAA